MMGASLVLLYVEETYRFTPDSFILCCSEIALNCQQQPNFRVGRKNWALEQLKAPPNFRRAVAAPAPDCPNDAQGMEPREA